MTDYHHDHVVVYTALGGNLRLASTLRATVTDTLTGDPVNVTQGSVTAPYVDVGADGRVTFTATTPNRLRLTSGATFVDVWPIEAATPSDAAVAGYVETASATRTSLDARYVTDAEADATVASLITAASATRTAADARYQLGGAYVTETAGQRIALPGLVTWRQARDAMATAPARILCLGDSITEGVSAAYTTRWSAVLASLLATRYSVPTSTTGYLAPFFGTVTSPITKTSATDTGGDFGVSANGTATIASGGTLTLTATGTSVKVYYTTGAATVGFTVKVDGVQVGGTYGGATGSVVDGNVATVAMGSSAAHTVEIIAGAGTVFVTGIAVFGGNESAGVQMFNAGWSGTSAVNMSAPVKTVATWQEAYRAVAPHLVIVGFAANDYASATPLATFQGQVDTILTNIRSAVGSAQPQPSILLWTPPKIDWTTTAAWGTYVHAMRTAAKKDGSAEFFDLGSLMPDIGSTAGSASGYYADTTHPTVAGHARIAQILDAVLSDEVPV